MIDCTIKIVYSIHVQCVMMYGSETWTVKMEDMQCLEREDGDDDDQVNVWSYIER